MTAEVPLAPPPAPPPAPPLLALRALQIGAIAVVLVVTTFNAFELDRFFVPKELVLHLAALVAGYAAVRTLRTSASRVDLFLAIYLLLNVLSAIFATNHWLGLRGLAMTSSSILIFWSARAIRVSNHGDALLGAIAIAVVIAAITSLLQTYGIDTTLFSENRVPGGTLGNRNFVAHVAAFGAPVLLYFAIRTRTFLIASIGFALVVGTLVLTRSRGAWLAFGAAMVVFIGGMLFRREARSFGLLFGAIAIAAGGLGAALFIPNTLKWRSDNPYVETAKKVVDYEGGSGRGRLIQYEHSLMMAARHPLFGVGPGNWAVEYPANAARNDPSISDSDPGTTYNPWPSSDWIAFISERGFAAAVLLALAFIAMLRSNTTLVAVLVAAIIAGMFDAVLLTAVPAFLVWAAIGALWMPRTPSASRFLPGVAILAIVLAAAGVIRSASQIYSMGAYVSGQSVEAAAAIDPGNYRLQLRLARGRHRCDHARAALALMPHAHAAIEAARGCK